MNFKEVLEQADKMKVREILRTVYKTSENNQQGFDLVVDELLNQDPVSSHYQISISHISEDTVEYDHVSGIVSGDLCTYSIGFVSHNEWIGMQIAEESLKNYSIEEIAAHCLWEMTYFGFREIEVRKMEEEIFRAPDEDACLCYGKEGLIE